MPTEVMEKNILPQIPVGRLGTPEEVARAVLFLADKEKTGLMQLKPVVPFKELALGSMACVSKEIRNGQKEGRLGRRPQWERELIYLLVRAPGH